MMMEMKILTCFEFSERDLKILLVDKINKEYENKYYKVVFAKMTLFFDAENKKVTLAMPPE